MARRRKGPARCHTCQRPIKWLKSPYSHSWRTFEPDAVNPHTHTGAAAFPVEGVRAWVLREFVEELMVRREQPRAEAEDEAYAYPWHVLHICPTGPVTAPVVDDAGEP